MDQTSAPIIRACNAVGGQAELARLVGVTPAAVNQWCKGQRAVPAERCPLIEQETRERGSPVLCEELRPDIKWGVVRENYAKAKAA